MRRIALLGCLLLAACTPEADTTAAEVSAMPVLPMSYELYGTPGPWWQKGATRADFDVASSKCVEASNQARRYVAKSERSEAAYRGFLECMQAADWTRGAPSIASPPSS